MDMSTVMGSSKGLEVCRGLEDGGTKNSLVNLDMSTIMKALLEICVRTNVLGQRKGKIEYLLLLLILLL